MKADSSIQCHSPRDCKSRRAEPEYDFSDHKGGDGVQIPSLIRSWRAP